MAKQNKLFKEIPNLWRPEFIPFYPEIRQKYKLSDKETLVYGFVRFFLKNCSGKFFFTNEQIRYVLGGKIKNDASISRIVGDLCKKCDEISATYKIKENGGKNRLLEYINKNADLTKMLSPTCSKSQVIENTIKNTYILRELFDKKIEFSRENPNYILLREEKEKFLKYWTEKSEGAKKEKWQKKDSFDVKLRWGTWIRNVESRIKPKEFKPKNEIISQEQNKKNLERLAQMKSGLQMFK